MDTREPEKVGALQPEPSTGEAVQGNMSLGPTKPVKYPSQMGNKSRVTHKLGGIKDSTNVLAIGNSVQLRRTKVNRKEWKIDRTMESR